MCQAGQLNRTLAYSWELCTGITSLFERHLKDQNPHLAQLSYDIKDLYTFVDQLVSILKIKSQWCH